MSDTPTPVTEKPAAAAAPEKPAEPPFNTDVLESCTTRYTRKAYNLYLQCRGRQEKIEQPPVRFSVEASSVDAAEEIHKTLAEAGVAEISREDKTVSLTTTFATLALVVKHPKVCHVDAVAV